MSRAAASASAHVNSAAAKLGVSASWFDDRMMPLRVHAATSTWG
jgi:hypothetical protein